MTDVVETAPRHPVLSIVRRIPATLTLIAVLLAVGIVFAGLWSPFEDNPLYETVAYGLPALLEGRDRHDDDDETEQDQGFAGIPHHQVDAAGAEQQQEHRFANYLPGDVAQGAALADTQFVRPFTRKPCGRDCRIQAPGGIRFHRLAG